MAIIVFPKKKEEKGPENALPREQTAARGPRRYIAATVQTGALAGQTLLFDAGVPLSIGRDPQSCDLVLTDYPRVSRNHCQIEYDPGIDHFYITDTSLNGTYLLLKKRGALRLFTIKKEKKSLLVTDSILFLGDENCIVRLSIR